jgi:5'-nucleotidase
MPTILIVNDDSIYSKGIKALVEAMKPLGKIVVVAPDKPQSGKGHAVTFSDALRLTKIKIFDGVEETYICSGTPVDCVKIAIDAVLTGLPNLCISGINHGSNASINVLYSGTMGAAIDACVETIPSIGISLCDHDADADFTAAAHYAYLVAKQMLQNPIPEGNMLNVNIPKLPLSEILGMKVCRQARTKYEDVYEERIDPRGQKYYWLKGEMVHNDKGTDSDEWALANGYVSIVPTQYDLTAYNYIGWVNENWEL